MSVIRATDFDFRVCKISFQALLEIQLEAEGRGWATRWTSVDALRSQVEEESVILQSLMREERDGAVQAYRCLLLFSVVGGSSAGGTATIDLAPSRYESLKRLDEDPDVREALTRIFSLAMGGISMVTKS